MRQVLFSLAWASKLKNKQTHATAQQKDAINESFGHINLILPVISIN